MAYREDTSRWPPMYFHPRKKRGTFMAKTVPPTGSTGMTALSTWPRPVRPPMATWLGAKKML